MSSTKPDVTLIDDGKRVINLDEVVKHKLDPAKTIFVGIDFGTICSAVYGLRHNGTQPEVWTSQSSQQYLLSTLLINNYDNFTVGTRVAEKPFSTIGGNKRILGLPFSKINKSDIDNAAYPIISGTGGLPMYKIKAFDTDKEIKISSVEVAIQQLKHIYTNFVKPNADGMTVKLCTTCPAFYSSLQRDILFEIRMFIFFVVLHYKY